MRQTGINCKVIQTAFKTRPAKAAWFCLLVSCLAFLDSKAQLGGYGIWKFVNLPPSSRTAALGGSLNCIKDEDVTLAIQNPALLNPSMHNHLALSYIDDVAGINFGSAVYARRFDSINATAMAGIQYLNYGNFIRTDETGAQQGHFTAAEYNMFAGIGKEWKHNFSYGAQLKMLYSALDIYKSFGTAIDVGGAWQDTAKGVSAGLVFKNIGYQFKTYAGMREYPAFEIQMGGAVKPRHMPVRFSLILHNLEHPDFTYINTNAKPQVDLATGDTIKQKIAFSEKIFRHCIFGAELLLSKNLVIQAGYNHQWRKELSDPGNRGLVGFSFGVGIKVAQYQISYGRATMSRAGSSNTFTLTTNFSEVLRKKNKE